MANERDKPQATPITDKPLSVSSLPAVIPPNSITPSPQIELFIDKQKEIDGVGMGVLSDGTAFLTGRGLARLCGISNARIVEMGQAWSVTSSREHLVPTVTDEGIELLPVFDNQADGVKCEDDACADQGGKA